MGCAPCRRRDHLQFFSGDFRTPAVRQELGLFHCVSFSFPLTALTPRRAKRANLNKRFSDVVVKGSSRIQSKPGVSIEQESACSLNAKRSGEEWLEEFI